MQLLDQSITTDQFEDLCPAIQDAYIDDGEGGYALSIGPRGSNTSEELLSSRRRKAIAQELHERAVKEAVSKAGRNEHIVGALSRTTLDVRDDGTAEIIVVDVNGRRHIQPSGRPSGLSDLFVDLDEEEARLAKQTTRRAIGDIDYCGLKCVQYDNGDIEVNGRPLSETGPGCVERISIARRLKALSRVPSRPPRRPISQEDRDHLATLSLTERLKAYR